MPGPADIADALDALERKLRELEHELGSPPPASPAPASPSPAPARGAGLDDLARQIDDLARFREQLQRVGRELEEEYERVLARLGQEIAATPAPAPPPEPEPEQAPPPPAVEPAPGATSAVVLDAGPFADLAALGAFEQAVAGIAGVAGVEVTGFEGRRALAEVRLTREVALLDELRAALPSAFIRATAGPDRLVLDLEAPA